ncbi:MAG: aldo/keto reductase [Defluviitaleaceae bacterium]|nr:aldo/keto reductase [Defluviitaleaceae bacterium]
MQFKELGKTGKMVSTIGLGCEHLDRKPYERVKEVIDEALNHGVNLLDVFMPGDEVREFTAKALGARRKDVLIQGHIGATDINQQYDISRDMPTVKKYFEKLLRLFGHIDFGMLFFIDSEEDFKNVFETEFITYAEKLKRDGDILHIGFSSHNPVTAARVIETGTVETVMFSINPAFDMLPAELQNLDQVEEEKRGEILRGIDPIRANLYKLCTRKNIGVTAMKILGAGKLLSPEHTPYEKPLSLNQCVHYALTRPAVSSVLPGCQTVAEMQSILGYFSATDAEKDYAPIISSVKNDFAGSCVYCSHCQPCPAGIDIAAAHKYLDIAKLDEKNIPPSIVSHYTSLAASPANCTACGNCEKRCPFDVPIIENLKYAEKLLR